MLIQHRNTKRVREVDDRKGQRLINQGFARAYMTRDMRAAEPVAPVVVAPAPAAADVDPVAPYGYKADGTPRKRPAPKKA